MYPLKNAPIQKGQVLGKVTVLIDNKAIAEYPLVALKNDPKGGLWTRMTDSVSETVHGWWGKKDS